MVSPEDFKILFDIAPAPCLVLLPDFSIVEANAAYLSAVARERSEVIGKNISVVFSANPDDPSSTAQQQLLLESLQRTLRTCQPDVTSIIRYAIPGAQGVDFEERYWNVTHTPVLNEEGHVEFILQQIADITELQRLSNSTEMSVPAAASMETNEAGVLRGSQVIQEAHRSADAERNYLRQLFQQAPGFFAVLRGPRHIFELANPAYYQLIGHRDIIGKPVSEAIAEIAGQGFIELLDGVYQSGEAFVARGLRAFLQREPNGPLEEKYVDLLFQPIVDARGAVIGIVVQGTDVSERKQAEEALRRANETLEQRVDERTAQLRASQAMIRIVYDHSSECHAVVRALDDDHFIYEEINPATLRLYGMTREQVIGRTTAQVFGDAEAAEVHAHLRRSLHSAAPYRYVRTHKGRIVEAVAARVPGNSDDVQRLVVSARDVTESRALEEQLRQAHKMEAVGQLTGGIAHDFNNLLTVVIGNLDRLKRGLVDERTLRSASMALQGARKAAALTHQLLAFSRKQSLDPKAIDLNGLVASMSDMLRRALGEAIVIETIPAMESCMTHADPNQVENALLNLALNARDAMPTGGRLRIETQNVVVDEAFSTQHRGVSPGNYVRLTVSDSGMGMSPAVLERAFEPFFTTKEVGQGSGLGLSMVYGFIKQSNGYVDIISELNKGTTVQLYLPRLDTQQLSDNTFVASDDEFAVQEDITVLAVEDNDLVREYTVEALRDLGYRVLEASDAAQALTKVQSKEKIDLLFSDIVLADGMNGRELARVACEQRPNLRVLLTTGFARDILRGQGENVPVISKPFTVAQLATRLREVLEDR